MGDKIKDMIPETELFQLVQENNQEPVEERDHQSSSRTELTQEAAAEAAATKRDVDYLRTKMENVRFRARNKIIKMQYSAAQERITALETELTQLRKSCGK